MDDERRYEVELVLDWERRCFAFVVDGALVAAQIPFEDPQVPRIHVPYTLYPLSGALNPKPKTLNPKP